MVMVKNEGIGGTRASLVLPQGHKRGAMKDCDRGTDGIITNFLYF